jgi:single-strand DNA-binding protein
MQKVIIIGRLARDPETRMTSSGKPICSFTVPVSEKRGQEEQTEWFRCKAFGKTAEFVQNYLGKGRMVCVEGKLQTQKYTDKNGQERTMTELLADSVHGLDRGENTAHRPAQSRNPAPSENMDDLPF